MLENLLKLPNKVLIYISVEQTILHEIFQWGNPHVIMKISQLYGT